jgi:hypothetical protein
MTRRSRKHRRLGCRVFGNPTCSLNLPPSNDRGRFFYGWRLGCRVFGNLIPLPPLLQRGKGGERMTRRSRKGAAGLSIKRYYFCIHFKNLRFM